MHRLCAVSLVLVMAFYLACAGSGNQKITKDRYLITSEEIQSVQYADTIWNLIQILRPYLLSRDKRRVVGFSGGTSALVYINGSRVGTKEVLQSISPLNVTEIQYIDGFNAPARYGYDAAGGVFLITMK